MKLEGKKVGTHEVTTPLHQYKLDVRLVVKTNNFVIYAPNGRRFSNPNLAACKQEVEQYLREGDVTSYVDVIEYKLPGQVFPLENDAMAGFDFRVARVSTARDGHTERPRLEKVVELDVDGRVVEICSLTNGKPYQPSAYRAGYDYSIPFTTERYRKCCALKEAILGFKAFLKAMLDDERAAENLDCDVVVQAGIVFQAGTLDQRLAGALSSSEEYPTPTMDAWAKECRIDRAEWSGLWSAVQADIRRVLVLIASGSFNRRNTDGDATRSKV